MGNGSNYTDTSNYGYTPTASWCIAWIVLFSVSAAVHSVQAWRAKYWVIYPSLVLGALIEVLGWAGRLWSNRNILYLPPFLMQICTLIIAPVFFSAFDYIILGLAIRRLGPQYSVLRPGWYLIVFLVADLISLILQAVGGGQAASSAANNSPTQSATNIMFAGIVFQLIAMGIFVFFGFDFILRAAAKRPYQFRERQMAAKREKQRTKHAEKLEHSSSDVTVPRLGESGIDGEEQIEARENLNRWWIMLSGCLVSSIMIVIRGVYRSIELHQGWTGYLMGHEVYQNVLDALPMVIAVGIFNILHPLYLLPRRTTWKGFH